MEIIAIKLIDSIFIGGRMISILNTVGTNVIVKSVSSVASSIGSLIYVVSSNDKKYVINIKSSLENMDLEHKVSVIKEFVKEIGNAEVKDSVKLALYGIIEILEKINDELLILDKSIECHDNKYFSGWRGFDCSVNINTLKKHKNILDVRFNLLLELIYVYK